MRVRKTLAHSLLCASLLVPAGSQAVAQGPTALGAWADCYWNWKDQMDASSPYCPPPPPPHHQGSNLKEIAHAALIPVGSYAGHLLLWNFDDASQTTKTFLVNPLVPDCGPAITVIQQELSSNIFCSGHTFLPDGSLVAVGGWPAPGYSHRAAFRFNPRALALGQDPWQPWPTQGVPPDPAKWMEFGRYYPTALLLNRKAIESPSAWQLDGSSVMVLGGPRYITGDLGSDLWEFQENALSSWRPVRPPGGPGEEYEIVLPATPVDDARLDSYPRALQLSTEEVFIAGDVDTAAGNGSTAHGKTWRIRPATPTEPWEFHRGPVMSTDRHYGTAVLIHQIGLKDRLIVMGGASVAPDGTHSPSASVQELFATGDPALPYDWADRAPLQQPRVWLNGVVLPTGDVLVTGGASVAAGGSIGTTQPVFEPELYRIGVNPTLQQDPTNYSTLLAPPPTVNMGQWCLTPGPTPRLYHHVSALLPDGRVFVAGGESRPPHPKSHFTAELYSPPYLFHGTRPVIEPPAQADLSSEGDPKSFVLDVTLPVGDQLDRIVLLRPASVTHHFDVDQRYIELEFAVTSYQEPFPQPDPPIVGYGLSVVAPDEVLAPAGWYMLFVVSTKAGTGHRVPSVGELVRFQ